MVNGSGPGGGGGSACDVRVSLKRDLSMWEVLMIGLGPTLGTTIFMLVGPGIEIAGTGLVLVFTLNFVVTIFTAMAYAELSSAFPDTGGGYLWVKTGMPQPFGFLAGWMSWFGHCIVTSFYVLGFGKGVFWILSSRGIQVPNADLLVKGLAVGVAVIFLAINYRGTKETGRSSIIIAGILMVIIILFIIAGLHYMLGQPPNPNIGAIVSDPAPNGMASILISMGFTFIVFEGYEIISQCGEECKDPLKNVPRASWLCIIISTIIFILVAIVVLGATQLTQDAGQYSIALTNSTPVEHPEDLVADVAGLVMPGYGMILVGMGIIIGTLAAINSTLFSSSRVSFAMGRDGALPRMFGRLHPRRNTPHIAIFTSGTIVIAMTLFLPIESIAAAADIMFLLLFFFVNSTAISLRVQRPDIKRHYVMPFFPWIPIIGIITKLVLAVGLWWRFHNAWFVALAWIVVGLVIYYFYGGKREIESIKATGRRRGIREYLAEGQGHIEKRYRILVPVVKAEQRQLVEFAALVARVEDADLNVMSIVEVPSETPLNSIGYRRTAPYIKLVEKAKKGSDRELVRARGSVIISHDAVDAIQDTVREDGVNLLVLGWKGGGKAGTVFGSAIDRLVKGVNCDVVVMKVAGLRRNLKRILVVSTPDWHVSHATGYAVLLAKRDGASITIFSASPTPDALEKEKAYARRLQEICRTHSVESVVKVVHSRSLEDSIGGEAALHDLVVMGAGDEWVQGAVTFGKLQDRLAGALDRPVLMVRKVREKD